MRIAPSTFAVLSIAGITLLAAPARAAETCGDGLDNDSDSLADEGCSALICEDPLSCGVTGAISPKLGAVVYPLAADLEPQSAYGVQISFQRIFMSHYRPGTGAGYRNPFGNMWTHNWLSWLDKNTVPNPDTVIVHLPSGQEVLFSFASTGGGYDTYTPQVGAHFKYLRQATSSPFKWELRSLTGETLVYDWSSPTGKLIEVRDSLASPNVTTISYDGSGRVQYVTDAQGTKRLKLSYNGSSRLTKVEYQTISSGTPTTRAYADYAYTSNELVSYKPNAVTAQSYTYSSNQLTLIEDDAGNDRISYSYLTGTAPTSVARLKTSHGELGFEYNSARAACTGGTMMFFNRKGTTACDADSDCGTGLLCGGQTNPAAANTGVCYRAARCLQLSSPSEDLITTVTPVGPPSESCEGACTSVAEYAWNTSSVLDLKGVKDPDSNWTSYSYDANGMPTSIVYGDSDNNAGNGGGARTLYLTYGDASFPGRVTERRRASDIYKPTTCAAPPGATTGCQISQYTYNTDGLLATQLETGYTLDASGAVTPYSYTTAYTYDAKGRVLQINGPLAGANDVTDYTYWTSSDVYKDGQRKEIKRKKDASTYLVTTLDGYDYWSNAASIQVPDGTYTCLTFDPIRNYLTQAREAMNGQTSCATSNALDLVSNYTRDKALRLTKVEYPTGGCVINEYDTGGRLLRVKSRDDCLAASAGDNRELTYDDDGLVIKTELINSAGTVKSRQEQTYHDSRRVASIINPVNTAKSTTIAYNARGFVDTVEAESSLNKTKYSYDADDRMTQLDRYRDTTNFDPWTLVHDWLDILATVTDGDSKAIQDVHDDLGRKVKTVTPDSGTTLRVYAADGTLASVVEAGPMTHTYTADNLRRSLTADYSGSCGAGAPVETTRAYDALPSGITCPTGVGCNRIAGRLAYVRTTLLCSTAYADKALDQETFYSYDDAGRMLREYVRDDTGRTADHAYEWTKNGALSKVTTPSSAVLGWSFGGSDNSDQPKILSAWRTSTATLIASNVQWNPFGPLASYRHKNQIGGNDLKTVIHRNLAYRVDEVKVLDVLGGSVTFTTTITEDDKGRVTARDFTGGATGLKDSFFLYDKLDRVTCETDYLTTSCPAAPDSRIKNSHDLSPPFTKSNDWKQVQRPIPGGWAKTDHVITLATGKDQISTLAQPCAGCPTALGTTSYSYDARGNRTSDDNTSSLTNDARTYSYDSRRNAATVSGKYYTSGTWHNYTMTSAFDARNRRVFKSFLDTTSSKEAQYFFYYDPMDRLTEIRQTPDVASPTTYSVYQIVWLGSRAVHMWETDYPSATTKRFYFHTDETTRPIETYDWPTTGNATRYWSINPDAYGNDTCLGGCSVLQPFVFPGQYRDVETAAWQNDGITQHRSALILNWFRMYDSFVGSYTQVDPKAPMTWAPYVYAANNPVGKTDRDGRAEGGGESSSDNGPVIIEGPDTFGIEHFFGEAGWHAEPELPGPLPPGPGPDPGPSGDPLSCEPGPYWDREACIDCRRSCESEASEAERICREVIILEAAFRASPDFHRSVGGSASLLQTPSSGATIWQPFPDECALYRRQVFEGCLERDCRKFNGPCELRCEG